MGIGAKLRREIKNEADLSGTKTYFGVSQKKRREKKNVAPLIPDEGMY
jgi:hypothetical protein